MILLQAEQHPVSKSILAPTLEAVPDLLFFENNKNVFPTKVSSYCQRIPSSVRDLSYCQRISSSVRDSSFCQRISSSIKISSYFQIISSSLKDSSYCQRISQLNNFYEIFNKVIFLIHI